MGRKKKFIDKKNSATFHLLASDSSSFSSSTADRVFVRVDNNPFPVQPGLLGDSHDDDDGGIDENEGSSIFSDALGDADDAPPPPWSSAAAAAAAPSRGALPENVRREILELGFPDDGYNYLIHLREIKGAGGGSAYFDNPRARLDRVPLDVKAYDASRVRIHGDVHEDEESNRDSLYAVASKTASVRVQRAVDLDVAKLLDDDDLSRFGSDVEDLEEDFVVKANCPEAEEDAEEEEVEEEQNRELFRSDRRFDAKEEEYLERDNEERELDYGAKQRVPRLLDEQFDMLTLREYDNDSESDDAAFIEEEHESLANKLKDALKEYVVEDLELDNKYRVPADFKHGKQESGEVADPEASADVIRRCAEYAQRYLNESEEDKDVVLVDESSDESEVWDCETIVSTYSNLDNHPGKIQAPENHKKQLPKNFRGDSTVKHDMIALRGKAMLPVDYLPQKKKHSDSAKKEDTRATSSNEKMKRRAHRDESKEEKKERKTAVKEERREARRTKKELKALYKCETQKAQKVVAVAGPSSIHLM